MPKHYHGLSDNRLKYGGYALYAQAPFILAEASILENRNVATHWKLCNQLAEKLPYF
jgi:transcriptional regulator GlxA family with amidase domain